jgi:D-glycero-D-manno-heptose 1,7-bisphosphate phosphatase
MKAVILDRDGVINKYPGDRLYVTSLGKFSFLPGARKAIALLHRAGFVVFVASNQAGVGRGIFSQRTLDLITAKMLAGVKSRGGLIRKVYYCTHRREAGCACRKPKPGMLKQAAREFKFSLKNVYFVGDAIRDILTARAAGAKEILVLSGKEKLSDKKNWEVQPEKMFKDLLSAAKFLVK